MISFKVAGRKIWEKVGWKSKGITPQIAQQYRTKRLQEIQLGAPVATAADRKAEMLKRNRTIGEIAEMYFDAKENNLKGYTTDRNRYDKHVAPLFKKVRVPNLTPLDMDTLKQSMNGKAEATIWSALELLRRIINFGAKSNLCPALPFTIEMPKRDNERVEYLNPEETERFLSALGESSNQEAARMLKLAYFTAMRRGEIFKLEDRDLDFQFSLIRLRDPQRQKKYLNSHESGCKGYLGRTDAVSGRKVPRQSLPVSRQARRSARILQRCGRHQDGGESPQGIPYLPRPASPTMP